MILRAVRKVDVVFGMDRDEVPKESLNSRCRITKRLTSGRSREMPERYQRDTR